jgi:hypothetical protein
MKTKQLTIPAITTMTSLAIVKLINTLRKEEGNLTELRHSDFLAKIEMEFLDDINERKISLVNYKDKKVIEKLFCNKIEVIDNERFKLI